MGTRGNPPRVSNPNPNNNTNPNPNNNTNPNHNTKTNSNPDPNPRSVDCIYYLPRHGGVRSYWANVQSKTAITSASSRQTNVILTTNPKPNWVDSSFNMILHSP